MGGFDGFWVNGETGAGHSVSDHALDVMHQPAIYGLTPHDVHKITGGKTTINPGDTDPDSARGKLIIAASQKGWVRVRAYRGQYTVQTHGRAASRLKRVIPFLQKNGLGQYSGIRVSDLSTGFEQTYEGAAAVHRAIKRDEIPDALSTRGSGAEARAMGDKDAKLGIPSDLPDNQQRQILRQHLLAKAGIRERKTPGVVAATRGTRVP